MQIRPCRARSTLSDPRKSLTEPGGVDENVSGITVAVGVDDGVGLDMVDAEAHQLDIVAPQRPQLTAVVLQGAFAGGG